IAPPDQFLLENSFGYGIARMIEEKVPPGQPVFAMDGIPDSYTSHEILVSFRSASTQALADALNMGWYEASQPAIARVFPFPERKVRRMRVVQKSQAPYPQQWSAHELRFYNHGLELTRKTGWRLHAWPNPWEAQLAFDNYLATRWRSGETASPGMFLDVDFGQEESVDEVRLIAS